MDSKRISFNFNLSGGKGIMEIYYGKGGIACFLNLFMIILVSVGFLLIPFQMRLDALISKLFFLLILIYLFYSFFKTTIEIIVNEDNIQFRTFKKYREFSFKRIRLLKIYYFWTTGGTSTIVVKAEGKSTRYYLWAPPYGERYDLFLKLVETLKKRSKGKFEFRYKR